MSRSTSRRLPRLLIAATALAPLTCAAGGTPPGDGDRIPAPPTDDPIVPVPSTTTTSTTATSTSDAATPDTTTPATPDRPIGTDAPPPATSTPAEDQATATTVAASPDPSPTPSTTVTSPPDMTTPAAPERPIGTDAPPPATSAPAEDSTSTTEPTTTTTAPASADLSPPAATPDGPPPTTPPATSSPTETTTTAAAGPTAPEPTTTDVPASTTAPAASELPTADPQSTAGTTPQTPAPMPTPVEVPPGLEGAPPSPLPDSGDVRPIVFPVLGPVRYGNDWGACRDGCSRHHEGNDILGVRMQPLIAATGGVVSRVRYENVGKAGAIISITDNDGWTYNYFHLNNDTPGSDDGAAGHEWQVSPGLHVGSTVVASQIIGYMGDSGNSESSVPHLHFEIRRPDGAPVNPYRSLTAAEQRQQCTIGIGPWSTPATDSAAAPALEITPLVGTGAWYIDRAGRVTATGDAALVVPLRRGGCDVPAQEPADPPAPTDAAARGEAPTPAAPSGVGLGRRDELRDPACTS